MRSLNRLLRKRNRRIELQKNSFLFFYQQPEIPVDLIDLLRIYRRSVYLPLLSKESLHSILIKILRLYVLGQLDQSFVQPLVLNDVIDDTPIPHILL